MKDARGNITITLVCGSFPFQLSKEWEADCKARFGDCRWMKMWHDHLLAKQFENLTAFLAQVRTEPLVDVINEPNEPKEPEKKEEEKKDEGIPVLGGGNLK